MTQKLTINDELKNLLPPLSEEELKGLEESILEDGCLSPLIVWGEVLIDGHNRHAICTRHNIPFSTQSVELDNLDDAKLWIFNHQSNRRNLTAFHRAEIALKLKDVIAAKAKERQLAGLKQNATTVGATLPQRDKTREELAELAGVGSRTLDKAEYISEHADEETKEKLRKGEKGTSINKEYTRLKVEERAILIDTSRIRTDLGTQIRVETSEDAISEYIAGMDRGDKFAPIEVMYDHENDYYILVDGFHRLAAHKTVFTNDQIRADVKVGNLSDATWASLAANKSSQLCRTNADKRNAVERAFLHPNGVGMPDREIARHVGVSHPTVMTIRAEMESVGKLYQQETRIGSDGKTYNAAKNSKWKPTTIRHTNSGYMVVPNKPPEDAVCGNCEAFAKHKDEEYGMCTMSYNSCHPTVQACADWKPEDKDDPVDIEEDESNDPIEFVDWSKTKIVDLKKNKPRINQNEKTHNSVQVHLHRQNPELCAVAIRSAFDTNYMAAIGAAISKLLNDKD